MTAKRVSSNEDKPAVRVLRQRELISQMHHENEVLRLDMTRQLRESKRATGGAGAKEIARLQEQAAVYIRKIQHEKAKVEEVEKQVCEMSAVAQSIMLRVSRGCVCDCDGGGNREH